jgi:cell division protein FtsL
MRRNTMQFGLLGILVMLVVIALIMAYFWIASLQEEIQDQSNRISILEEKLKQQK